MATTVTVAEVLAAAPATRLPYSSVQTFSVGLLSLADSSEVLLLSFLPLLLDFDDINVPLLLSSTFIGELIGTSLGYFGDIYGRRPISLISAALILFFGILSSVSPTFGFFIAMRIMVGVGIGALSGPYDLLSELLHPDARGKKLLEVQYWWTVGSLLPILLLVITKGAWRSFTFLAALPALVCLVTFAVYGCESPEWLVSQGREEEVRGGGERALESRELRSN